MEAIIEAKRSRLRSVIGELDETRAAHDALGVCDTPPEGIMVVIGTSHMAHQNQKLVLDITEMVNQTYCEASSEFVGGATGTRPCISQGDVLNRLAMGDAGILSNRVLHLVFTDAELVGCCSSTYQPPWTPEGCGHWGLFVVKQSARGTGVAAALVAAAEARLAGACSCVQIQYRYTKGQAYSERLLEWYEGECGFRCVNGPPRRSVNKVEGEVDKFGTLRSGETEFRTCMKLLPRHLTNHQRSLHLRYLRRSLVVEGLGRDGLLESGCSAVEASTALIGRRVVLRGLQQRVDLNGRSGLVKAYDSQSGRRAHVLGSHELGV